MRRALAVLLAYLLAAAPVFAVGEGIGQWRPPEATSGGNPFSLSGSSITNATLSVLRSGVTSPFSFSRTKGWATYYFSSAAGGDLPAGSAGGTGTATDPFDASLLDNYCISPGVMCILDSGETFVFPATIRTISTNCTDYPNEPCIVITTTGAEHATITTAGTAATDGPIFAFDSCTDAFNAGGPPQTTGTPDGLCDTDAVTSAGPFGWVVVHNINVVSNQADTDGAGTADNMDAFSVNSGNGTNTKVLLWNTNTTVTGDASDNGYTSHGGRSNTVNDNYGPKFVVVNSACTQTSSSTNASNHCFASITGSKVVIVGLDIFQNPVNLAGNGAFFGTSANSGIQDSVWIDGFIRQPDPAATAGAIEINPDASSTVNVTLAKVGVNQANDTSQCIRIVPSGATSEVVSLNMYQTTVTGCTDGISIPAMDDAARVTINGTAFACDAVADNCINIADNSWRPTAGAGGLSMTLTNWLYDSDDSASVFNVADGAAGGDGAASDTSALLQADFDSVSHTFTISVDNSTVESNDAQVQWSDGSTTFAKLNCISINDCWNAYDSTYTITFPFALPAFIFGAEVTGASLNGNNGNIGR